MDGIQQVAQHLTSARVTLQESNAQAARTQRDRLEALLGEFIDCSGVFESVGGMCNLLTIIAMKCEERSRREGDDFERVARLMDAASGLCDLRYEVAA